MVRARLETERLILRQPTLDDAPDIQRYANHPEVARNTLSLPHPYPEGAAEEFLRQVVLPGWEQGTDFVFAITRRDDGAFMGVMGVHPQPQHHRAEVGYWVGAPFWSQGYATEALRRVIQFGFEELVLNRMHASYFTFNPASRRVMDKAGMTFEGVLREYMHKDGEYIDVGMCSLLRREWRA